MGYAEEEQAKQARAGMHRSKGIMPGKEYDLYNSKVNFEPKLYRHKNATQGQDSTF